MENISNQKSTDQLKAPSLKRRLLTRCRLTDGYENSRCLIDACGHIYNNKKCILVIFGKFKKRNPRVVIFFRRILDRNVVVWSRLVGVMGWLGVLLGM